MTRDRETGRARNWALRALTRRMHTVHQIRTGLEKKGFGRPTVDEVVAELGRLGYLDDLAFARTWIGSRSAHGFHSRLRLARDLRQKGVPEEVVRDAMDQVLPVEKEVESARRAAEKKARTIRSSGPRARAALYRHLSSRGFTADVVRAALDGTDLEEKLS